jgi:diguanylate cyclase (GGDEF)-like protein/PAS domain S-box-containing protein
MNALPIEPIIRLTLIDSDPAFRQICRQLLDQHSSLRFELREAGTGRLGLKLIRDEMPDCIVIDRHLPDFDLNDLIADLAAETDPLPVPIIVMTSNEDAGDMTDRFKCCISDCLVKSVGPEFVQRLPDSIARAVRQARLVQERNEALERLRQAEAKYRALAEQIQAITYIASLEAPGKLLYVSPQTEQLGYSPETWLDDPLGIGLIKWVHPDDREMVIEQFSNTYEHHAPLLCEYRVITGDGKARWVLDQARVVHDDDGQPLFLQGTLVDIDKDKQLERELEHLRRRLEEMESGRAQQLKKQSALLQIADTNTDKSLRDRREFERCLEDLLIAPRECRSEHVFCYLDLDHFRVFNNTYGRAAGDQLLQTVGDILERRLRQSDILGRLGGDKFGLLLENCSLERARIVANNLRDAVRNCSLPWAEKDMRIGVSIGITALTAVNGDAASVLRSADAACRIAKRKGRDRTFMFDDQGNDVLDEALAATLSSMGPRTDWPVIVDANAAPLRKKA